MPARTQPDIVSKFGQVVGVEKARMLINDAAEAVGLAADDSFTRDECIKLCLHIEKESSDVTAAVANDIRIRLERQKHFASLFSVLPDPAMIVTLEYDTVVVISVNDAGKSIFGFGAAAHRPPVNEVVDPRASDNFGMALYRHLARGDQFRTQIATPSADRVRHFVARFSPVGHDELPDDVEDGPNTETMPTRGILVFTEITEEKEQQQDIEHLQQATAVMNRVLRHNLRNAMTTIIGRAEHLRHSLDDEVALDCTESIIRAGNKLTQISQNARTIQELAEEINKTRVDLVEVVRSCVATLEQRHDDIRIRTDLTETAPAVADAHLHNVIENVLKNGVEHNDKEIPVLDISVRTDRTAGETVLTISDNGPGIPEHELDVLDRGFETPLEHGTGLGIWLVWWTVEQYGGTVSFDDRRPAGTTVEIRLDMPNQ